MRTRRSSSHPALAPTGSSARGRTLRPAPSALHLRPLQNPEPHPHYPTLTLTLVLTLVLTLTLALTLTLTLTPTLTLTR